MEISRLPEGSGRSSKWDMAMLRCVHVGRPLASFGRDGSNKFM